MPEEPEVAGDVSRNEDVAARHLERIEEKEREASRAKVLWQGLKSQASEAKKEFDLAVEDMMRLIEEGPDKQLLLPFGDGDGASIEVLELGEAVTASLVSNQIFTISDLKSHINNLGGEWNVGIGGIGDAAKAKIETVLRDYES